MTAKEMPDVIYAWPMKKEWSEHMIRSPHARKYIRADAVPGDKQAALDELEVIMSVAGDIELAHFNNGKSIRGNVGPIVTRACKRLRAALLHDDSGWNYNTDEAPRTGERILVCIEGNTRCETASWDGKAWRTYMAAADWTGHRIYAWKPLPSPAKHNDKVKP